MRDFTSALSLRARIIGIGSVLILVLAILALTGTAMKTSSPPAEVAPPQPAPPPMSGPRVAPPNLGQSLALDDQIARLREISPPTPTGPRSITGEPTKHPDLYAREFVNHLLTQNYRTPRTELLAWVQSEAVQTSEPLVIGMVPPHLRNRWAVFSVTDSAGGMAPIPVRYEWARLARLHGYTTVEVQRVSEPMAWSSAVSSGRITDAGVTGREVTALVTLHTVHDGRAKQSVASVALTLNLEGPPARPDWGFVTVVTYTEIPVTPR